MNFKFDKDTVIIIAIGCLLMVAWAIYLPKYQAKRAEEYQRMLQATQQNAAPGATEAAQSAAGTAAEPGQTQPAVAESPVPANTVPQLKETRTVVLKNDLCEVTVDGLTGSLHSVKLTGDRYKLKDSGEAIELFRDGAYRTFELKPDPALVPVSLEVKELGPLSAEVLRTFAGGLKLTQTFTLAEDDYTVLCKYVLANTASAPVSVKDFAVRLAGLPPVKDLTGDKIYSERMNVDFCKADSGVCDSADPQMKSQDKFDVKTTCTAPVSWVGSTNKYFASLLFAADDKPFVASSGERIWQLPAGSTNEKDLFAIPSMTGSFGALTVGSTPVEFQLKTYCGPKEMARIRSLGRSVMGVMHISY